MLTLNDLFLLALLAFAVNHWWRARGFKALALQLAAQRCQQLGVQLLDQSVALRKIRLQRGSRGLLQLRRSYDFEFSSTGSERYRGSIVLVGNSLQSIEMEPHIIPDDVSLH